MLRDQRVDDIVQTARAWAADESNVAKQDAAKAAVGAYERKLFYVAETSSPDPRRLARPGELALERVGLPALRPVQRLDFEIPTPLHDAWPPWKRPAELLGGADRLRATLTLAREGGES